MVLKRISFRPNLEKLQSGEANMIRERFDPYAGEVLVNGHVVYWDSIQAVEVVRAPRVSGLAGLFVLHLVYGAERYHVGIYSHTDEVVLPNLSLIAAQYVVQSIAFYAPNTVRYTGPDGLVATSPA